MDSGLQEMFMEISQGNPGALSVVIAMMEELKFAAFMYFSLLKKLGILGPRLWVLYKKVAEQDIHKTSKIITLLDSNPTYMMEIRGKEVEVMQYIVNYPNCS